MSKSDKNKPPTVEFFVTVDKMERTSIAQAEVLLKGSDNEVHRSHVTVNLRCAPHQARAMPFSQRYKLTLEPIEDEKQ